MICLDTNAAIAIIDGRPPEFLVRFERRLGRDTFAISMVVVHELWFGVARSSRREENTERLHAFLAGPVEALPFDADDAREAGDLRADLLRIGRPIGPYDVLIAAQARRRGALLVTANQREFRRVKGLRVEDWAAR